MPMTPIDQEVLKAIQENGFMYKPDRFHMSLCLPTYRKGTQAVGVTTLIRLRRFGLIEQRAAPPGAALPDGTQNTLSMNILYYIPRPQS